MNLNIERISPGQSLKARVYESLKEGISSLDIYARDAELRLDERDLSHRYGISRTPLREALAQLDREGLVRIVARRGTFIVRKTKAEIIDMITVWAALESMAARIASQKASKQSLAALRNSVDAFSKDDLEHNADEYSEANIKFHQAIVRLADSPLIGHLTNDLFFHVRAIRRRTIFEKDRAQRSIVDHRAIIVALEKRDSERAERLVREHTLKLRDHVERYVEIE